MLCCTVYCIVLCCVVLCCTVLFCLLCICICICIWCVGCLRERKQEHGARRRRLEDCFGKASRSSFQEKRSPSIDTRRDETRRHNATQRNATRHDTTRHIITQLASVTRSLTFGCSAVTQSKKGWLGALFCLFVCSFVCILVLVLTFVSYRNRNRIVSYRRLDRLLVV